MEPGAGAGAGAGTGATGSGGGLDSREEAPGVAAQRAWRRVPFLGDAPCARSGAASAVWSPPARPSSRENRQQPQQRQQSLLFVFGGFGGAHRLDDFFELELETFSWRKVAVQGSVRPGPRENNGLVAHGGCLYLFGGYDGSEWLSELYQFTVATRRWRLVPPRGAVPSRRFGFVSFATDDHQLFIFGGFDGEEWLDDMHMFDMRSETWTAVLRGAGPRPPSRSCPAWAVRAASPGSPGSPGSLASRQSVVVFGGYDGECRLNDLWEYRVGERRWVELRATGPRPSGRYFHSCAVHGDLLFAFGGYDGERRLDDLHAFSFAERAWLPVRTLGGRPSGRSSVVAHVVGDKLIVLGGYSGTHVLDDLFEFPLCEVGAQVHAPRLKDDLRAMLGDESFCDVAFVVEGRHVLAVRALLAGRSEYFRAMLFGGIIKESRRSLPTPILTQAPSPSPTPTPSPSPSPSQADYEEEEEAVEEEADGGSSEEEAEEEEGSSEEEDCSGGGAPEEASEELPDVSRGAGNKKPTRTSARLARIELPDVRHDVFVAVLEFLYTDEVRGLSADLAVEVLDAAERFVLPRLRSLCEEVVVRSISLDNCVHVLLQTHLHNAASLEGLCLDFIVANIVRVRATPQFQQLKQEPELLMELEREREAAEAAAEASTSATGTAPATVYSSSSSDPGMTPYTPFFFG